MRAYIPASNFFKSLQKFSLSSSNFRGVNNRFRCDAIVDNGFRGNSVIDGGNGQSGVVDGQSGIGDTESQCIGDIVDGLEFTGGIDVLVASGYTSVAISDFVFLRVDVAVTVFGVSEFILEQCSSNSIFNCIKNNYEYSMKLCILDLDT